MLVVEITDQTLNLPAIGGESVVIFHPCLECRAVMGIPGDAVDDNQIDFTRFSLSL